MEIVLAAATILGGIAAAWYFFDKWRDRQSTRPTSTVATPSPAIRSAGAASGAAKPDANFPTVVRAEARAFGVLMGEDDGATRHALRRGRDIVVAALKKGGGKEFDTHTDTVVTEFGDIDAAVRHADAARETLAAANRELPTEHRVHYRFGIELGSVISGPDGPEGEAVERAAVLGLHAQTDGIRLTAAVRAGLPEEDGLKLSPLEKGDYALATRETPTPGIPPQLESLDIPLPERPSIALLPFKSLGDDPESAALAEGLRIDIQNAFTKMSGLFLLAAGSASALRGVPAADAGPRVGVRHVLEGTVQRLGDQFRVNVQLVDTLKNAVVWSERYDRMLDHSFSLQDEITERIVTALDVKLASGEQARIWHKCLADPRAREVFYRGIQAFVRMNAESMASARACFERVAELAKDSPLGATNVAMALWFQATRGWTDDPEATRASAGDWAERAAAMNDADGQAQTVLGNVRLLQRRFDEALAIAHNAVAIRPGCTNANGFLANVLLYCGRPGSAVKHAKRAIRFMPVYPPWFVEILASAYRDCGQDDFAVISAREVLRIAPSTVHGRLVLASALVRIGWLADARRVARQVLELDPGFSVVRFAKGQPYRDPDTLARITEDLRKAGLPE